MMAETLVLTLSNASGLSQDNATPMMIGPGQNFFMAMPYLGTPRTPYFDSKNVTYFLDRFFNLCADYKLSDEKKIKWLPWYCDMRISQSIKTIQK